MARYHLLDYHPLYKKLSQLEEVMKDLGLKFEVDRFEELQITDTGNKKTYSIRDDMSCANEFPTMSGYRLTYEK